jgi:pimeloyl-ACP methyl ester carboxylesterase
MDGNAPFVLVPGAWSGGWNWKPLVPLLRAAGHDAYPLTLTGLGERCHLLGPEIDLETHISDVVNTILFEDLQDVVLVGHSYAGIVVTGAAARVAGRLRNLVYLDSTVPEAGQCFRDTLLPELQERNAARADGWRLPVPDGPSEIPDLAVAARVQANQRTHPIATMTQPLAQGRPAGVPCSYIFCTGSVMVPALRPHAERARAAGFGYYELPTIHHCMYTMPRELADILLAIARRPA